jgi:hypothetical protein
MWSIARVEESGMVIHGKVKDGWRWKLSQS